MTKQEKQNKFLELLAPVNKQLSNFARALTKDYDEAKDLVSDTLLAAYESFEKIKDHTAFKSWLFTVAVRLNKRRNWRKKIWREYDESYERNIPDTASSPELHPDVEILYKAISLLPEKQAEAIVLFEIAGFSIEEVKKIQGGSLSGVKTRLRRAREKLKDIMIGNDKNNEMKMLILNGNAKNGKINIDKINNKQLLNLGLRNE